MSRFIGICLAMGVLCLLSAVLLSEAIAAPGSYRIKGRPVSNLVDALSTLHKFLSNKLNQEQRCQRQAVVLTTVNKAPTNQFEIADIALGKKEEVEQKYFRVNVELLRNLYINATREYLEKKHVDSSLIELLGCLKAGYRNRDAKARSFLNDKELNSVIEQFESISKQPLKVLLDGDAKQTGLNLREFNESVKESISNWVARDEEKIKKLFADNKSAEKKQPETEQNSEQGKSEGSDGEKEHHEANKPDGPNDQQQAHEQGTNPEAQTPEGDTINEEDQEYLETVFGSLIAVYESLPEQAGLGDRCHAYNRVIQADREQLFQEEFVEKLVSEASKAILEQGVKQKDLMPDERTREDFLFIVETFDPLRAGPEVWLDLNECLSKWVKEDENVVRFLQDPGHIALFNQLTAAFENENAQAYAGASVQQ